jgi:hypothetical protein
MASNIGLEADRAFGAATHPRRYAYFIDML